MKKESKNINIIIKMLVCIIVAIILVYLSLAFTR